MLLKCKKIALFSLVCFSLSLSSQAFAEVDLPDGPESAGSIDFCANNKKGWTPNKRVGTIMKSDKNNKFDRIICRYQRPKPLPLEYTPWTALKVKEVSAGVVYKAEVKNVVEKNGKFYWGKDISPDQFGKSKDQ